MSSEGSDFAGFSEEENARIAEIVFSQKNKQMLNIDGHLYNFHKQYEDRFYWDCARRKHGKQTAASCKARATTELRSGNHHVLSSGEHVHEPNPIDQLEKQYRTGLKRKAVDSADVPSKIVRETSINSDPIVQTRVSKSAQKMLILRTRQAQNNLIVHKEDGEFVVPDGLKCTISGQPFLQKDDQLGDARIMMFCTEENVNLLKAADFWICDGTFSTAPSDFSQLFSIHAPVGTGECRKVLPLVYFLLTSKSQELYTLAFETLLDYAAARNVQLNPKFVLSDFEKAVINTVKDVFPESLPLGCFFHFSQNLMKHISSNGLKSAYSTEKDVFMAFKKLQGLSFLPSARIVQAYEELKPNFPAKLNIFLNYFAATYIFGTNHNGRPMFNPSIWSNFIAVVENIPCSSNILEAWHNRWRVLVGSSHLSVGKMINELRKEQHETEGQVLRVIQGLASEQGSEDSRKRRKKIAEKCADVDRMTNEAFVTEIALCLASKTRRT